MQRPHLPHLRLPRFGRTDRAAAAGAQDAPHTHDHDHDHTHDHDHSLGPEQKHSHADGLEPLSADEVVGEAIEYFSTPYPENEPPMHGNA